MKIQPLTTPHAFTRLFFGPEESAPTKSQSFTDLFLSAVAGSKPHPASSSLSTPAYVNPALSLIPPSSLILLTQSASTPPVSLLTER